MESLPDSQPKHRNKKRLQKKTEALVNFTTEIEKLQTENVDIEAACSSKSEFTETSIDNNMEPMYNFISEIEKTPIEKNINWRIDLLTPLWHIPDLLYSVDLSCLLPLEDSSNSIRFFIGKSANPSQYGALYAKLENRHGEKDLIEDVGIWISAKVADSVVFDEKYINIKGCAGSKTKIHDNFLPNQKIERIFELKVKFAKLNNFEENSHSKQLSTQETYINQVGSFFYSDDNFADVVLVSADGMEHGAHKFLLAARSSRFQEIFRETPGEKVNLPDVNGKPLVALLHFIYTGEMHAEANRCMKGLLHAAIQYDLCGLLKILDKKLICICKKENMREVFELHQLAKDNVMPTATKEIAEFIRVNI